MKPSIWIGLSSLALMLPGCAWSPAEVGPAQLLADLEPAIDPEPASRQVFDLGPVLAHGQTIRHEFVLENPTGKPIRLLASRSFTPCCSAVESLPKSILPHGDVKVSVLFKPGYQSGLKVVRFAVQTDSGEQPIRTLILRARLFSEFEIAAAGDSTTSLPIGNGGRQAWHITCRRKGTEGLGPPEQVKIAKPLQANFLGPPIEQEQPDGVVETTRDVEVILPAIPAVGSQQAELAILWPEGLRKKNHVIRWEITPRIRLIPSSIVLDGADTPIERSVTITSDDGPFRITRVAGTLLSGPFEAPAGVAPVHQLRLPLDTGRGVGGKVFHIVIGTDQPHHPKLDLRVLILPPKR